MPGERLDGGKIADLIQAWPNEVCELALLLREFVLRVAPQVSETIAFHSLCYYKPDQPYGVIGGNVCMIGPRKQRLCLGFIHGVHLADPDGLLQGSGKSARHIEIRTRKDFRNPAVKKLIQAAVAFQPTE